MRTLVTGGTGFLGAALSRAVRRRDGEVRILAKEATPLEAARSRRLAAEGIEVVVGDVTDEALCRRALDGVDTVHHIAAAMREANVPDEHFWEVNVRATERLLRLSREAGVRRFVYCGTSGAVGPSEGRATDEETECRPKDIYQTTKLAAERAALAFQRQSGLAVAVVRPAGVYGPGDGRLLKLFRMAQRGWVPLVGDGRGKHHLIYIDDLVAGMLLAASRDEAVGRCYNLADDRPVPLRDLIRAIAEALGVSCRCLRVPLGPARLAAGLVEAACRPLGIQPPIYRRRLDFFVHDEEFAIDRACRELGFEPAVPLAEGLRRTVEDYRARGWLAS